MKWSSSAHRPRHLYVDGMWYFVTAPTVNKVTILSSEVHLHLWMDPLRELTTEFEVKLVAWVVLPNHYHLLFMPNTANELGNFMKQPNGGTSHKLNLHDNLQGRTVWYSYWDRCMRNEHDFLDAFQSYTLQSS